VRARARAQVSTPRWGIVAQFLKITLCALWPIAPIFSVRGTFQRGWEGGGSLSAGVGEARPRMTRMIAASSARLKRGGRQAAQRGVTMKRAPVPRAFAILPQRRKLARRL